MNCTQAQTLLRLYADGELDAASSLELEGHALGCPACSVTLRNLQSMKKALRQDELFFRAPEGFKRQLEKELRSGVPANSPRQTSPWNWLAAWTSGLAVACLVLLIGVTASRPSAQELLVREIVAGHIRSLMANHALDVASTDQHTVKPWFNGKIDFAPPVKDLAAQGFPLIGDRLDYLGNRTVAALVFQRHKHVINLFVWPGGKTDTTLETIAPSQGYNLVHWSASGMTFWTVSDVNQTEMMEFARAYSAP